MSYSPPTFSLLPHRAANGPGPRGMQVPKFRDMVASLCQVIRLRLFLIITIENVTGGLGLFFPRLSARIVMHSVVVQAHIRKIYWDELADLPTQPCLCTVSPSGFFQVGGERKEAWVKLTNAARAAGYYGPFEFNLDDRADLKKVRSRKRGFAVLSLLEPTVPLDAALQVEVRRCSQAWTVADSFCSKEKNIK